MKKKKPRKKKKEKLNNSASSNIEILAHAKEMYVFESNLTQDPKSSDTDGELFVINDELDAIDSPSTTSHPDQLSQLSKLLNINSEREPSYTPPGTPPKRELTRFPELSKTDTEIIDANNNDINSTEEPRAAADMHLQELIARNLRRLKQNQNEPEPLS